MKNYIENYWSNIETPVRQADVYFTKLAHSADVYRTPRHASHDAPTPRFAWHANLIAKTRRHSH